MCNKKTIMNETEMFDYSLYYDRIANQLPNDCVLVEVGVADAKSALYIANRLHSLGKNFKLYMVDNLAYGGVFQLKTIYENIIKSGIGKYIEVLPVDSLIAAKMFNGNSLHFVFLDSSHTHPETAQEIELWYPRLLDGGILAGHDYTSQENPGVKESVDLMLPKIIKRPDIDEEDHKQEFLPHQFLSIEQTERELGVWSVVKNFYFTPKISGNV